MDDQGRRRGVRARGGRGVRARGGRGVRARGGRGVFVRGGRGAGQGGRGAGQGGRGAGQGGRGAGQGGRGAGQGGRGAGQGGRGAGQGGRGEGGRARQRIFITDEMRATVIDHVIVHGMTMTEAGQRVQPNLSRFSVATIIRAFREHNRVERLPYAGGRASRFTPAQEVVIVDMVRENNVLRLREIRERIIGDNMNFPNIDDVSLTTIDRVLKRQRVRMKQAYRVPFERNSDRIKHLRHQYVQRIFELESMARPHEFIFVDEAGFNLTKRRRRGRNIIGQRAIVDVPGQRGGNITLCAAMSSRGLLHRHAELGAYNTERLLTFLGELREVLHDHDHPNDQQNPGPADLPIYVIFWDNKSSSHHGGGRSMTANRTPERTFSGLWTWPVMMWLWRRSKAGCGMPGHSSHDVWLWTILPVTWMRYCGPTQSDDVMPPNDCSVNILCQFTCTT
ncbi:uncharacterized protein LOC134876683 isoform X2 [Eleginops maclovinus]|uniref:uncharacterized protein LOC134876683 isoform X2 n=1 Tax=Eleginops maclovinus TaxID=56733 RepID=UPI003080F711